MQHTQIFSFLWSVANLLRDTFKRGHYQDVILPLTVLRRLDCVLAPTKQAVLKANVEYRDRFDDPAGLDGLLRKKSGFAFYNTSLYDFERLAKDAPNLKENLFNYIQGFSPNMREVIERFNFYNTVEKLADSGLLFQVVEKFKTVDLHPDTVPNHVMGTIFEELIRKFNEALNENPGEHFTPRDVVGLMAALMLTGDEERLRRPGVVITVSDPCCGTGGMLTTTKDFVLGSETHQGINPDAQVHLFGQEVNPETFAICKSDLFMKEPSGYDADRIVYGSVLEKDGHPGRHFDYQIANPPYGMSWKQDKKAVEAEARRGTGGRFAGGIPGISDGQLLFLQHTLSHMKSPEEGSSRVAIITNGSPLFTGDAGSGESEIRRWVLENDWLEALVALPEQLFYNTGIATYVWVLANRKPEARRGKVLLIDATDLWQPMRKSLGDKRREISEDQVGEIVALLEAYEETERTKIFPTTHFGYRKIRIERPLQLNFQASPERIARLDDKPAFKKMAKSGERDREKRAAEEKEGRDRQEAIRSALMQVGDTFFRSRTSFREALVQAMHTAGLRLTSPLQKAIEAALSERDSEAETCRDQHGEVELDPQLVEYELVPLAQDPSEFFEVEVKPHAPSARVQLLEGRGSSNEPTDLVYRIDFRVFAWGRIEARAREARLTPYHRRAVLEDIRSVAASDTKTPARHDTVYVPTTASGNATLALDQSKRGVGYLALRVRPAGPTTARYLSAYLNSPEGRAFREVIGNGKAIKRISIEDWSRVRFFLPSKEVQQEVEELLGDIREKEVHLATMETEVWRNPNSVAQLRSQLGGEARSLAKEGQVDSLPSPLATALWTALTKSAESLEKVLCLERFLEAAAQFHVAVLLSGVSGDAGFFSAARTKIHRSLAHPGQSLKTASFGTWINLAGILAKNVRQQLNSGEATRKRVQAAFRIEPLGFLEVLTSSATINIFQAANDLRNRVLGHGGVPGQREIEFACGQLDTLVNDYLAGTGGLWPSWLLVVPDHSRSPGGRHEYTCEKIVGAKVPFQWVKLPMAEHISTEQLHLYDAGSKRALPLVPLISIERESHEGRRNFYFYNRLSADGLHFVTYHHAESMEIIKQDDRVVELLKALSSQEEA